MGRGGLRFLTAALVVFVSFVGLAPRASAAPQSPPPKAFILVDAGTGRVLQSGHDHEALPPASLVKLTTALTAIERLPSTATLTVSPLAASQPAMRIGMVAGQKWKFVDVLSTLMIISANDAAYAIAENTSGSVPKFVAAETAMAHRLGMKDSTFSDPAGLDDAQAYGGGPRMSAYDIAISARNALAVPVLRYFAAMKERTFTDPSGQTRALVNHNKMLDGAPYSYAGDNGLKTGFTNRAGHTFVATATRNGRTLIAVILNTYDAYGWAAQLLDQGFATRPNAKGTGERLPPVRVSPYGQRVADRTSFLALTTSPTATAVTLPVATTTSTTPAERAAVVGSTAPPVTLKPSGGKNDSGSGQVATAKSGWFTTRNAAVLGLFLLAVFVVLRRRVVSRQRRRRMAQRRAVANAMRRGTLQVVDGRYRTGARVGPLIDSDVRVHRKHRTAN